VEDPAHAVLQLMQQLQRRVPLRHADHMVLFTCCEALAVKQLRDNCRKDVTMYLICQVQMSSSPILDKDSKVRRKCLTTALHSPRPDSRQPDAHVLYPCLEPRRRAGARGLGRRAHGGLLPDLPP